MGTHPIFESDFDCLTEGMSSTADQGWLRSLRQDPDAYDPGFYPIGYCFNCSKLVCYLPAFQALEREIACILCGIGPGNHAMERGVIPIPQLTWQVNHAQFTTMKPPTIEELHSKVHVNAVLETQRVRPTDLPLEIESISLDDHVTLGSEEEEDNKSPVINTHRGRINSSIDDNVQQHGPAQE